MPNDATSWAESLVDDAAKWMKSIIEDIGPEVLNRPLFSAKVSKKDQLDEYEQIRVNPQAVAQLLQERTQVVGPDRARKELVDHFWEMEQMRGQIDTFAPENLQLDDEMITE